MKNKMASFLNMKKICCSIACFSLLFATSCTALGLPEKDPAGKLRTYYQEGKDGKANDILIRHKLVAIVSDISYPGVEIRTLPSQLEKGVFDDPKHTLYHVALYGQSSSYDYFPLLTLELLSEKDGTLIHLIISLQNMAIRYFSSSATAPASLLLFSIRSKTIL